MENSLSKSSSLIPYSSHSSSPYFQHTSSGYSSPSFHSTHGTSLHPYVFPHPYSPPTNVKQSQSFQYFLLSPTYANVINVYAFCNVHDVSWGTRDAPKPAALGSTKITSDGNIDADISSQDLDALYSSALAKIAIPCPPEQENEPSKKEADEAYYRNFRSYVVLAWMFCNAALVAIILNSGGLERLSVKKQTVQEEGAASSIVKTYLLVVLWSVAGLSAFKFVGAMWYLIGRIVSLSPS